jgi:halimadienyl-diphosphate synthase
MTAIVQSGERLDQRGDAMPVSTNVDVLGTASRVVQGLRDRPWGEITASVYETARLVSIAPWVPGHADRLEFLIDGQRDGRWGQPDGYDLVPTLSATEALLAELARSDGPPGRIVGAVRLGLVSVERLLTGNGTPALPDTPAIELIVPSLVGLVNAHLVRLTTTAGLEGFAEPFRLRLPDGFTDEPVKLVRALLRDGGPLPAKLLHSLEIAVPLPGPSRTGLQMAGPIGASPAATAAWLTAMEPGRRDRHALRYLQDVLGLYGAAVPSVIPITAFERAWVLSWLADSGIAQTADVVRDLHAGIGPHGSAGGAGLPPDADTTSVILAVLDRYGSPASMDCLLAYDAGTHFYTWPGERTPSVSTNAHVVEAFGGRLAKDPAAASRYGSARTRALDWLCGQQEISGSWTDKWHASPFYATACSVIALTRSGLAERPSVRAAIGRAVRWVLDQQRSDGSWGRWSGTHEETAYALHILSHGRGVTSTDGTAVTHAIALGRAHLLGGPMPADSVPLWHDKDLYQPGAIVRAAVIAAIHLSDPHGLIQPTMPATA